MDVQPYLDRIGYSGPTEPALQTLRQLHLAHLMAVPFENLSVISKQPIMLDEAALYDKIVARKRGGFCYELNSLFAWLLRAMGYQVTLLSVRVAMGQGHWSREFDHMALQVTLGAPWLVDVGFGDSFCLPLRLNTDRGQVQAGSVFRVINTDTDYIMQHYAPGKDWHDEYRFTLQPHQIDEFDPMCQFHQASPESPFTLRRVCSRTTPDGRITISDMRLITTHFGQRREQPLRDHDELRQALWEYFGVAE
ncbi:MAG TPA: arylamine N-acetyltransferase [Anaerolineae bacterium]